MILEQPRLTAMLFQRGCSFTLPPIVRGLRLGDRKAGVSKARFPFKRNRLRCVRCVWMETGLNASACVGKQPITVATASTEHPIRCKQQPIGCSVEAVATVINCLPTLRLARFPSKRNARNASDCVWMETGLYAPLSSAPL